MPATANARIKQIHSLLSHHKSPTPTSSLKLDHLKQIHSLLITCGLSHHYHAFLLTRILLPGNCDLLYSSSLFDRIPRPNVYLWNAMIRGFSTSSEPHMSIVFFARMRFHGIFPNKHTFPLLLKAKFQNPFQIYAQILKFGFTRDRFVQNALVSAFASRGYIDVARQVFDEITHKDVIGWTAMIDGYVRNERAVEALELFVEMKSMGVRVDEVTVVSVLCAAGMVGDVWFGRWVHGSYVESGRVHWDAYVGSALVDMYCKCGYCDEASKVFEEMPCRNLVSWSALIAGYVQCNRYKDALLVFQDMLLDKVEPNQSTLSSVLTACAQLGALDQGRWVHKFMDVNKLKLNSTLGTALINMYAKCGCIKEAFLVFEKMSVKDVYLWTVMINGLAMHGDAASSLNLFSLMLSNGFLPNEVTLLGVLSACSHGGFIDEGRKLFGLMTSVYGLEPNVDHYGCMVDLLGRAGQLEEAIKLIENMPMEPTPGVWGALFGACMIHKAYEFGEWIGKHLIKLQPHHSGRYALLANLYSTCRNWEAAAHVRKLMKDKGVAKTRGCSWIELNGVVHEFIAFDKSHTASKTVYVVLDSIIVQLERVGCVSDTDILLFDIDRS